MLKVFGVALLAVALATAVVPNFTDCQSQGHVITMANGKTTPMKCHWSGQAELAAAVPLLAVGAMMTFTRRRGVVLGASIMGVILGAFVMLLPTKIIGVCGTPGMICNSVMLPSLLGLGSLGIVASAGGIWFSRKE